MIHINSISKSYGDVKALDDINIEVSAGEIFGLIGVGMHVIEFFDVGLGSKKATRHGVGLTGFVMLDPGLGDRHFPEVR